MQFIVYEAGKPASAAGPQQFLVWCAGEARASHSRSGGLALRARICSLEGGSRFALASVRPGEVRAPRSHHRSRIVDFASQNANFMKFDQN